MMFKEGKISSKTKEELERLKRGGRLLGEVKAALRKAVKVGANAAEIEDLAVRLIDQKGGIASFKGVPGYSWATCVNVNEGLVHGIPKKEIVFKKGDVVSVDVGMLYEGFHTDTSFTVGLEVDPQTSKFLEIGEAALKEAIKNVKPGSRIFDISKAIEDVVKKAGFAPIRDLVGHGIGRALHEFPQIPCFTSGKREESPQIPQGATLAIEVMYALGSHEVEVAQDSWTIAMRDAKISALFEETVAATAGGPLVLTEG
jgi:methionyl aminopeptidase